MLPHNEYSSLFTAWEYADDKGWIVCLILKAGNLRKMQQLTTEDKKLSKDIFHERLKNNGAYDSTWTYI